MIEDKICSLLHRTTETLSLSGFACTLPQPAAASPLPTPMLSVLRYIDIQSIRLPCNNLKIDL